MPIIGNRYYELEDPVLLRFEEKSHCKVLNSKMVTDLLIATGDNATDTRVAPGAGILLEVFGYQITEWEDNLLGITTPAHLKFETSGKVVWSGIPAPCGAVTTHITTVSGIRLDGANNEALTLRNADRTTGNSMVNALIYYRVRPI